MRNLSTLFVIPIASLAGGLNDETLPMARNRSVAPSP